MDMAEAELTPEEIRHLLDAAEAARKQAHAPLSHFRVGAAVLAQSGQLYTGCNVENSSYRLTTCAEQAAIARAVTQEGSEDLVIRAVAVTGGLGIPCSPCGACRQIIFEFGAEARVCYLAADGLKTALITQLLPDAFRLPITVLHSSRNQ